MEAKKFNKLPYPPYSPDLAPADFFIFPKGKELLAGTHVSGDSVRTDWEQSVSKISVDSFGNTFR